MQPLKNILKQFVRDFGIEGSAFLKTIQNRWESIVGQTIAVHTFPDTIKNRVLTIIVDTPQWIHHLSFYKKDISLKLKEFDINDVRFRLGRLPETCNTAQEEEEAALSEEESRYIENTVRNIRDKELKEKFRTLIKHGLTRGKSRKTL